MYVHHALAGPAIPVSLQQQVVLAQNVLETFMRSLCGADTVRGPGCSLLDRALAGEFQYESTALVYASPDTVHFLVTLSRPTEPGEMPLRYARVWVLVRQAGRWVVTWPARDERDRLTG